MKKFAFLLLLCCCRYGAVFSQYSVRTVPDPKQYGQLQYVSNPDGVLSAWAVDSLNRLASEVEERSGVEIAVVAVDDYVGSDDFEFALELYNHWGIGNRESNAGLLLFIARDKRAYRFITGYGLESTLPDALLKQLGEQVLVPHFRKGEYSEGTVAAMGAVRKALTSEHGLAELRRNLSIKESLWYRYGNLLLNSVFWLLLYMMAWKQVDSAIAKAIYRKKKRKARKQSFDFYPLMVAGLYLFVILFLSIFVMLLFSQHAMTLFRIDYFPYYMIVLGAIALNVKYGDGMRKIENLYKDKENKKRALFAFNKSMLLSVMLSPPVLIKVLKQWRYWNGQKARFIAPDAQGTWQRLNRDEITKLSLYLDKGQQEEERLGSRSYELWQNSGSETTKAVAWKESKAHMFSTCPACHYETLNAPHVKTLKAATFKSTGKGQELEKCTFCQHEVLLGMVVLPVKVRDSGSASGGGYTGSGGDSSSGGSWGGGSSGGGGAGGHW